MAASVSAQQRHTRAHPCPICGGYDEQERGEGKRCGGYTSADGLYSRCSREDFAGTLVPDDHGLYRHRNRDLCHCGQRHGPDTPRKGLPIEAIYAYHDEEGNLVFEVVRLAGKQFRQRRPDGMGGWVWKLSEQGSLPAVRRILYRLPELMGGEDPVYLVEGEKDVDRLRAMGVTATTTSGGAGKARLTDLEPLRGRRCIIVADADDKGREHAADLLAWLGPASGAVAVESGLGKDVSDHLDAGGTLDTLVPMRVKSDPPVSVVRAKEPPALTLVPPPPPRGPDEPPSLLDGYPRTDTGNAERLVAAHGRDLRYVRTWDRWLHWDGRLWADDSGAVYRAAKDVARSVQAEALKVQDYDSRASGLKYAMKLEGKGPIEAAVSLARHDLALAVSHTQLDEDRMQLNVANGTVDLRTGNLWPHARESLCTCVAPTEYDPAAKAPTWEAFMSQVMGGDLALVAYLQRLAGYALTGEIREHVLVFFYGPSGGNGKSTFLTTLSTILGSDYAGPSPRGMLVRSAASERHPTELASLYGKRFVTCSETQEGTAFDEPLVKDLTGGDLISTRRMREDFWSFRPTHKLFIAGQHKPTVRGDDGGIWRRMKLVPWTVSFTGSEDKTLGVKLMSEAPGILKWCVDGCLAWQREGLGEPDSVLSATAEYRRENDQLGEFFRQRVVFDPKAAVARKELRAAYEEHCKELGAEPMGAKRFSGRLRENGASDTTVRVHDRVENGWRGVRLASESERAAAVSWDRSVGTYRHQIPVRSQDTFLKGDTGNGTYEVPTYLQNKDEPETPFADWVDENVRK